MQRSRARRAGRRSGIDQFLMSDVRWMFHATAMGPSYDAILAELGDPHADIDAHAGSLEKLLELAAENEAAGLGDAPWPPHFRKIPGEAPRVAPSRAAKKPRTKMPLLVIANSRSREAALAGLERWKKKHSEVAKLLTLDDVLIDSMRGRSSPWTRVRVNLRHVPETLHPLQETPDPDDDPTREWRTRRMST